MQNRTCLEIRSMDERHREELRNTYGQTNVYDENHQDARATGDEQGKGTGSDYGPNDYTRPYFIPGMIHTIDYRRFDTNHDSGAGNGTDNAKRDIQTNRSKYSANNQYCPDGVLNENNFDVSTIPWSYSTITYTTGNETNVSTQPIITKGNNFL